MYVLDGAELGRLVTEFMDGDIRELRIEPCHHGFKYKINERMWSPVIGRVEAEAGTTQPVTAMPNRVIHGSGIVHAVLKGDESPYIVCRPMLPMELITTVVQDDITCPYCIARLALLVEQLETT